MRSAEEWWAGKTRFKVERQRGVYIGVVDRRETGDLNGRKVAIVCPAYANKAVSGGSTARLEWQCRYVRLCLCGCIEAVDVAAARVVYEVLLRRAYEVA